MPQARMPNGRLAHTLDATIWAEQFARRFPHGSYERVELLGWFAAALATGYNKGWQRMQDAVDHAEVGISLRDERLRVAYTRLREVEEQLRQRRMLGKNGRKGEDS